MLVEDAFVESFKGRFRDECLNEHWFRSLDEARGVIEDWRRDFTEVRPHNSLGGRTPFECAAASAAGVAIVASLGSQAPFPRWNKQRSSTIQG
jgi:transposase InsO family protein